MKNNSQITNQTLLLNRNETKSACSNSIKIFNEKQNRNYKKIFATTQLLQECLLTLDIFKSIIEEADQMKNRVIRDVIKSINIACYNEGDIIYEVQDPSNEIFLIFQGQVSLNIKKAKPLQYQNKKQKHEHVEQEFIYQQIDTYQKGQGFGQAQFIRNRKRDFQTAVKQNDSIIGKLNIESFEEVVQNYKMRIYFKKLQMFQKCPLLSLISSTKLQFIVNNSKPILLNISKTLIREGETPKYLYLVSKGQLQIYKNNQITKLNFNNGFSAFKSKKMSKYFINGANSKDKVQISKINEGAFIGDIQIALQQPFEYDVRAVSQKVYLYACDIRLILSQLSGEQLQKSKKFYQQKYLYQNDQIKVIKKTRKHMNQNYQFNNSLLTPQQLKIKKQIRKRYLQTRPFSLVDESSPSQIDKMLERKRSRIKKFQIISPVQEKNRLPKIQSFEPKRNKKYNKDKKYYNESEIQKKQSIATLRSPSSLSTKIIENMKIKSQRNIKDLYITQPQQHQNELKINNFSLQKIKFTLPSIFVLHSKAKIKMQSEKKRLQKQRIKRIKTYNNQQNSTDQIIKNRRLSEFIQKIKLQKQKQKCK